MKQRHFRRRLCWVLMRLLDAAAEQGEHVVGQQRDRKAEQRGAGMAEAGDLAVQHAFQTLEHAFNAPASAV